METLEPLLHAISSIETVLLDFLRKTGTLVESVWTEQPTALIAGALGAFFGGVGAQFALSRSAKRAEVHARLSRLAQIHQIGFTAFNVVASVRLQQLEKVKREFEDDLKRFKRHRAMRGVFIKPKPFVFKADLTAFQSTDLPIDKMLDIFADQFVLRGRAFDAALRLIGALKSLENAILRRSALIKEIRNSEFDDEKKAMWYFGIPDDNGHVDFRFHSTIKAIDFYSNDRLFFSHILCADIERAARRFRFRNQLMLRFGLPRVGRIKWKHGVDKNLIPQRTEYEDWLTGFDERSKLSQVKSRLMKGTW